MNYTQYALLLTAVATATLSLVACSGGTRAATTPGERVESHTLVDSRIGDSMTTITLLGFDGCPLTPLMKSRLETALSKLDETVELVQVNQKTLDPSDLRRGYPAPTVVVNGSDLFGMAPPTAPSMGCRMYDGPGGVPSVDELSRRLSLALSSGSKATGGGA